MDTQNLLAIAPVLDTRSRIVLKGTCLESQSHLQDTASSPIILLYGVSGVKCIPQSNKYNLNFSSPCNLNFVTVFSHRSKFNVLEGLINDAPIKIYDSFSANGLWLPVGGPLGGQLGRRGTVLEINNESKLIHTGTLGYATSQTIEHIVKSISNGTEYADRISKKTKNGNGPYLSLLVVVILIAILIKVFLE